MSELEMKISKLPPHLQKEVERFVDSLAESNPQKEWDGPEFKWEGALKHLRDKYTSVELQHKISDWRIGKE
jgi:hypothetical protein